MKRNKWEKWLENPIDLEKDIINFKKGELIELGATEQEMMGHFEKAKRNLRFSGEILEKLQNYHEWSIISYYYAAYQAALSLCALNGYKTKQHLPTLAILFKYYYPKKLNKEDMNFIKRLNVLNSDDIDSFLSLKELRENASYGISHDFEMIVVKEAQKKSITFVNKVEQIIHSSQKK